MNPGSDHGQRGLAQGNVVLPGGLSAQPGPPSYPSLLISIEISGGDTAGGRGCPLQPRCLLIRRPPLPILYCVICGLSLIRRARLPPPTSVGGVDFKRCKPWLRYPDELIAPSYSENGTDAGCSSR